MNTNSYQIYFSMTEALQISMNSTSIQPPNQLYLQTQQINQDGNGEKGRNMNSEA